MAHKIVITNLEDKIDFDLEVGTEIIYKNTTFVIKNVNVSKTSVTKDWSIYITYDRFDGLEKKVLNSEEPIELFMETVDFCFSYE